MPPFSPNAPCNRSHFFFLGPALDSEIRCFHHTSLPPTVQLLSNILVSTEFPPSPRAQNHRSTSFVGKIWIDCDCDSTEFDRVARNENCGETKKVKTESFQPYGYKKGLEERARDESKLFHRPLFKYSKQLPTTMRCYHLENGEENAGEIKGRGEKGRKQGV